MRIPRFIALYGGSTLFLTGSLGFIFILVFSWAFRDGMAPGSIDSHGLEAIAKTLNEAWQGLTVTFLLVCSGAYLMWRGSK